VAAAAAAEARDDLQQQQACNFVAAFRRIATVAKRLQDPAGTTVDEQVRLSLELGFMIGNLRESPVDPIRLLVLAKRKRLAELVCAVTLGLEEHAGTITTRL
jgi:hypothetical protein